MPNMKFWPEIEFENQEDYKKHIDWEKPVICLSMGAGVQTTAILIKYWERYKNGVIIFADTGDEDQQTYWYIEHYLKPFCKEKGLKWATVVHKHKFSLMEWCMKRRIIPIKSRRWCTQDFKIKPINRLLRILGAKKKTPIIEDIGISLDESHRANFSKMDVQYVKKNWPLMDDKITRRNCHEIIQEYGWPQPPKSGCDFCMFQKRSKLRKMLATPEGRARLEKINEMEKNDRFYPRKPLIGNYVIDGMLHNNTLDGFMDAPDEDYDEGCDSGHCFT
jgi:hypothetical protein